MRLIVHSSICCSGSLEGHVDAWFLRHMCLASTIKESAFVVLDVIPITEFQYALLKNPLLLGRSD